VRAVRCGIGSAGVRVMGAGSAARFEAHLCGSGLKLLSPLDAYAGGRRRAPCPLEGVLRRGWRPTLGRLRKKTNDVPSSVSAERNRRDESNAVTAGVCAVCDGATRGRCRYGHRYVWYGYIVYSVSAQSAGVQ
jgi:hypothetical protein